MRIRNAQPEDVPGLTAVARSALRSCCEHALGASRIESVTEDWYSRDRLFEIAEDESAEILVAESEETIVALADLGVSTDGDVGLIRRFLVDPDVLESSVPSELLAASEEHLFDRDVLRVEVSLLEPEDALVDICLDNGFVDDEEGTTTVGETELGERRLVKFTPTNDSHLVVPKPTDEGTFYIAFDEGRRGSKGAFFAAYRDEHRDHRFGFFCDNCESIQTTMDSMGRVACSSCGNTSKPTQWDATNR
ncbi:MAG: GNAT family N-acetyltransferase [Halodesulfurarchaeum sp.]